MLAPGGVLAVWSYERCSVNDDCDPLIERIFRQVEDYWPPERSIVIGGYAGVVLPIEPVAAPLIDMTMQWTVEQALGYFRTWSACRRYCADRGHDPFASLEPALREAWGDRLHTMRWPLALKAGRA